MNNLRVSKSGAVFVNKTAQDKKISDLQQRVKQLEDKIKNLEELLKASTKI